MARLYADENFPLAVVRALRAFGHDVVTIQERGQANLALGDPDVLRLATLEERALLTLNRRDFIRLHGEDPDHFGIVVCTIDAAFAAQAIRIHDAIGAMAGLRGQLIRVNRSII